MDESTGGVAPAREDKPVHRLSREVSRSLVLDTVREVGRVSRVDVARRTGLSKPTVSEIVEGLLKENLLLEVGTGPTRPRGGRPPTLLTFNDALAAYAGIQVTAGRLTIAIADGLGRIVADSTAEVDPSNLRHLVRTAARMVRDGLRRARIPRERLRAAGVTVPGHVDVETSRCTAPQLDWVDVDVAAPLQHALDVPVVVASCTVAATTAEAQARVRSARRSMVYVCTADTVYSGVVVDGRVLMGGSGMAGEIAHSPVVEDGPPCDCGNRGCLQTVAGGDAVVQRARQALRGDRSSALRRARPLDAALIAHAAHDGDVLARGIVVESAQLLGRGIAPLVNALDPELLVLGGPLAHAGDVYVDAVRDSITRHAPGRTVPVEASTLGSRAPLLGAVQMALERGTPSWRIVRPARRAS